MLPAPSKLGVVRMQVTNNAPLPYSNPFTWIPPASFVILAVINSDGGTCQLLNGNLSCRGGAADSLTVTFSTAGRPWFNGRHWTCDPIGVWRPAAPVAGGPIYHGPPRGARPCTASR